MCRQGRELEGKSEGSPPLSGRRAWPAAPRALLPPCLHCAMFDRSFKAEDTADGSFETLTSPIRV